MKNIISSLLLFVLFTVNSHAGMCDAAATDVTEWSTPLINGQYGNGQRITDTLSIPGASSLTVKIESLTSNGGLENQYDYIKFSQNSIDLNFPEEVTVQGGADASKGFTGTDGNYNLNFEVTVQGAAFDLRFISDGSGNWYGAKITATATCGNGGGNNGTAPQINTITNQTTVKDQTYSFDTSTYVTKTENDPVTYSATGLPDGLSINGTTGIISGTPTKVDDFRVSLTVTDKDGSALTFFNIKVNAGSSGTPPTVNTTIPTHETTINQAISLGLSQYVTVTDGDAITKYNLSGTKPPGVSFSDTTGAFSGTPSATGDYALTLTATDKDGTSTPAVSFTIKVNAANNGGGDMVCTPTAGDETSWTTPNYPSNYPNSNTTNKTLSIAGAQNIKVKIKGELESGWDYIKLSKNGTNLNFPNDEKNINNVTEDAFTGVLDVEVDVSGSSITIAFKSDDAVQKKGVEISITGTGCSAGGNNGTPPTVNTTIPTHETTINQAISLGLSQYVTATDGDAITAYNLTGTKPPGITYDTGTGVFSGSPSATGDYTLTLTATDKDGTSDTAVSFGIKVVAAQPTGSTPVVSAISDYENRVNTQLTLGLAQFVTDADNDVTTYTLTGTKPPGIAFDPASGAFSGTSSTVGDYPLTIKATDDQGHTSNEVSFTIKVVTALSTDTPPVMDTVPNQTTPQNGNFNYSITYVTRTDGDPILNYILTDTDGLLTHGVTFNAQTGLLQGTPTVAGTYNFSVKATDKDGESNVQAFIITVTPENNGGGTMTCTPTAGDVVKWHTPLLDGNTNEYPLYQDIRQTLSITGAQSLTVTIKGATESGYDGVVLYANSEQIADHGQSNINTRPSESSGRIDVIAFNGNIDKVLEITGSSIEARFLSDESGNSFTGVQIEITGKCNGGNTNTPPTVGTIPNQNIVVNQAFSYGLSSVTSEPDGDTVTYALTGTKPPGVGFDPATGILSGTPSTVGTYDLSATATDKDGTSSPAQNFTITVVANNGNGNTGTPPTMNDIPNKDGIKDQSFSYLISFVTLTDGDNISEYRLDSGTLPTGLTFDSTSGTISGTPTQTGQTTLSASAKDKDGWSNSDSFTINITAGNGGGNGAMTCTDEFDANNNDDAVIITTLDGITSSKKVCIKGLVADGNEYDFYKFTVQVNGTLNIDGSLLNGMDYSLAIGKSIYQGEYYGPAQASTHDVNNIALQQGDTVYVTLNGGEQSGNYQIIFDFLKEGDVRGTAPVVSNIPNQSTLMGTSYSFDIKQYVSEADGDAVTYAMNGNIPDGLTFNTQTGILSGTPTREGPFTPVISATDKDGKSNDTTVTFNIESNIQEPPKLDTIPDQTTVKDKDFMLNLSQFVTTTNNDAITSYSLTCLPNGLAFDTSTGIFNGQPASVGEHTCTARAYDNDGGSTERTFALKIIELQEDMCENYDYGNNNGHTSTVTSMNGITTSKSTCIKGRANKATGNQGNDGYVFTVQTQGTLNLYTKSLDAIAILFSAGKEYSGDTSYYPGGSALSFQEEHTVQTLQLNAGDIIYLNAYGGDERASNYQVNIDFQAGRPPVMGAIPNQEGLVGDNFFLNTSTFVTLTDNDHISKFILSGALPNGLSFDASDGVLNGTIEQAGTYTLSVSAQDRNGVSNVVTFTLTTKSPTDAPPIITSIPNMMAEMDRPFSVNLDSWVWVTDNDPTLTYILSGTLPSGLIFNSSNGEITGKVTDETLVGQVYTLGFSATDKDGLSNVRQFTIKIRPKNTIYTEYQDTDFERVNSAESRNVPGDYVILGNTLECGTTERYLKRADGRSVASRGSITMQPNDDCQNTGKTQNNDMSTNYIDIDNNSSTWASTSSNFTLPENAKIVWAGLFWTANLTDCGRNECYGGDVTDARGDIAHAVKNGDSYSYVDYGIIDNTHGQFNIQDTDANKILIKVDNDNGYQEIKAESLKLSSYYMVNYVPTSYHTGEWRDGRYGGPYSAYADITKLIKRKNLKDGEKHTVTVANITASIGFETGLGLFGGWSMVVIYNKPSDKVKNISIYNGMTMLDPQSTTGEEKKEIKIRGFKLPKTSEVEAWLSIFTAEGESNIYGDTMELDGYEMPGGRTTDGKPNLFDEQPVGLDRDDLPNNAFNNLKFSGTIDIDRYNVSSVMTTKRDADPNTSEATIKLETGRGGTDAFFPSMVAFSTDLYIPDVCYDYEIRMGKDIPIPSRNREVNATFMENLPLDVSIALRSRDGDFPLKHSKLELDFTPSNDLNFTNAKYSSDEINFFKDAPVISPNDPVKVAFGTNADMTGGTVKPLQTLFVNYEYQPKKVTIDTKFDLYYYMTVDFGAGDVNMSKTTKNGGLMLCGDEKGYKPELGIFNIERQHNSGGFLGNIFQSPGDKYGLYTKIAGKQFTLDTVLYNATYTNEATSAEDITVGVELIDVDRFHKDSESGNSVFVCSYPDPLTGTSQLVKLPAGDSRAPVTFRTDFALPNIAVRVRYLTDGHGNLVPHNCNELDGGCFQTVYDTYYKNDADKDTQYCTSECNGRSGCYECLNKYFTKSVCSRDNFSIRPESYKITMLDTNQSKDNAPQAMFSNNSSAAKNIIAEYKYLADGYATLYNTDAVAKRYYQFFKKGDGVNNLSYAQHKFDTNLTLFDLNPAACNDKKSASYSVQIVNGSIVDNENNITNTPTGFVFKKDNVGRYKLHVADSDFTKVDQKGYRYKPYPNHDDCEQDSSVIVLSDDDLNGCSISSDQNDGKHFDLGLYFVPDHFNLSTVQLNRSPSNGDNWIYMYGLCDSDPMALSAKGSIEAKGANDTTLTNFVQGCSAEDIDIKVNILSQNTALLDSIKGDLYNTDIPFEYLVDRDYRGEHIGLVRDSNISDDSTKTTHTFSLVKENFIGAQEGMTNLKLYYNFNRTFNDPVNPVKLKIENMNVSTSALSANGHLATNYKPEGTETYNKDFTFIYGAATPSKYFYDAILSDEVITPISLRSYCSLGHNRCQDFGINVVTAKTNRASWWKITNHDQSAGDGNITIKTSSETIEGTGTKKLSKFTIDIDQATGEDQAITVSKENATLPFTFPIEIDQTKSSEWLIFNPNGANVIPSPYYKVRFVGDSNWTGVGETGKVLGSGEGKKSTSRVGW